MEQVCGDEVGRGVWAAGWCGGRTIATRYGAGWMVWMLICTSSQPPNHIASKLKKVDSRHPARSLSRLVHFVGRLLVGMGEGWDEAGLVEFSQLQRVHPCYVIVADKHPIHNGFAIGVVVAQSEGVTYFVEGD